MKEINLRLIWISKMIKYLSQTKSTPLTREELNKVKILFMSKLRPI